MYNSRLNIADLVNSNNKSRFENNDIVTVSGDSNSNLELGIESKLITSIGGGFYTCKYIVAKNLNLQIIGLANQVMK